MAQGDNPRRVSLVFPIILIAVGALFLFRNWHPGFDPVPILWTYWPLILIFIGLGKIWDNVRRSRNPNAPPGVSIGAGSGTDAAFPAAATSIQHQSTARVLWNRSEQSRRTPS